MTATSSNIVKRSSGKAVFDYVFALILLIVWIVPIIWFINIVCNDVNLFERYFWMVFTGWTATFIIQLFYDSPSRRLLSRLIKSIIAASKWDADSWFLQIFLWFLLYCYGIPLVLAVAILYSPVSAVIKAVTGK